MKAGTPAFVAIVVLALLVFVILKVLGVLIGLVVKLILLAVAVGAAVLIYAAVKKQIGGSSAR